MALREKFYINNKRSSTKNIIKSKKDFFFFISKVDVVKKIARQFSQQKNSVSNSSTFFFKKIFFSSYCHVAKKVCQSPLFPWNLREIKVFFFHENFLSSSPHYFSKRGAATSKMKSSMRNMMKVVLVQVMYSTFSLTRTLKLVSSWRTTKIVVIHM